MPTGVPKHRSHSGQGRYPNNIDTMRRAAGVLIKDLIKSVANGGVGMTTATFYTLLRGNRPVPDVIAARLASRFKCSIDDLRWKGTAENREIVPYEAPAVPAVTRGRPRKVPSDGTRASDRTRALAAPAKEPIEITVARGGQLLGGVTMFHPRDFKAVLRDIFGGDDQ